MQFAATPPVDGTLAKYYAVPEELCFVLPSHISIEEGALVEPLSIAVHCARLASITIGQTVLVMGAGPIGLLCCAVAKAFGASVIAATDIVKSRLAFAEAYATSHTYEMERQSAKDTATAILSKCGVHGGFDVVIDATGVASCIASGIFALKKGGVFIQAGLGAAEIAFPVGELCSKEGVYKTSFRYGPGDYKMAVELLESRRVSVKSLITHSYEFESAEQAFVGAAGQEGIKCIIYGPRD
jgi:L-iditol 2-dehydrogenase